MKHKNSATKSTSDLAKKGAQAVTRGVVAIDESSLFERIAVIIESRRARAESQVNAELTLMYWEIGNYINSVILDGGRGAYGKEILATLSPKLVASQKEKRTSNGL